MCCGNCSCSKKKPKAIPIGLNEKTAPYTKVKPRPPNKSLVKR